ncbi:MAG: hypothetical protein AB7G80_03585 [Dongiaceae bacterium]
MGGFRDIFTKPEKPQTNQTAWKNIWNIAPDPLGSDLPDYPKAEDQTTGGDIRRAWHDMNKNFVHTQVKNYFPKFQVARPAAQEPVDGYLNRLDAQVQAGDPIAIRTMWPVGLDQQEDTEIKVAENEKPIQGMEAEKNTGDPVPAPVIPKQNLEIGSDIFNSMSKEIGSPIANAFESIFDLRGKVIEGVSALKYRKYLREVETEAQKAHQEGRLREASVLQSIAKEIRKDRGGVDKSNPAQWASQLISIHTLKDLHKSLEAARKNDKIDLEKKKQQE